MVMSSTLKSPSAAAAAAASPRAAYGQALSTGNIGQSGSEVSMPLAGSRTPRATSDTAGGEEAAGGVGLADGQAEFQRLLAEPRRLLGPAGQLSERGLPGQRAPAAPGVTQVRRPA